MIPRIAENEVLELVKFFPCVAITGPRQVGKTTLVKTIRDRLVKPSIYLDLETISDSSKLADPETFLLQYADQTVIIDEIQRLPGLFPLLRSLIDQRRDPARFILLGSASPDLIRDSSESLAGRIAYFELTPFIWDEVKSSHTLHELWQFGGFPDALLRNIPWRLWMNNFVRTYLERDLPNMGFSGEPRKAERLWTMLAHVHGNPVNYSEISKSLELSSVTIKKYIDFLDQAYLVRQLRPYTHNLKKRLVKTPKVYLRDSGILHYLLGIQSFENLLTHPKMGSSWEGFAIEQIAAKVPADMSLSYYRTHDGSELDLVLEKGGRPWAAVEVKYGSDVRPSKGNILARENLGTTKNFIVTASGDDYLHSHGFRICPLEKFTGSYLVNH